MEKSFLFFLDFTNHPSVKWNFLTPFGISTHRLKANFSFIPRSGSEVVTGIRSIDNPWRNMKEWSTTEIYEHQNYSAIQHMFASKNLTDVPTFVVQEQIVYTYLVRGLRNGQKYA